MRDWNPCRRNADIATSASAQISDSCTSPPLEKMPTTVQSLSRKAMRDPTPSPSNCWAARRPTMTSRTPRAKRRPSTRASSSRMAKAAGCTPRNGTLLGSVCPGAADPPSPPARRRPAAAPPRLARWQGRLPSSTVWSRATPLDISASEPARSMITRSSRPVLASVWRNPSAMESTDTSTPATPAMPMMTTRDVPRRWGRLRRLTRVICAICSQRAHHRCPARASTMRSRRARQAGGRPTISASAAARPPPRSRCRPPRTAAGSGRRWSRSGTGACRRRRPCPPRRR